MRFGVIVFPGTYSDRDCGHVLQEVFGQSVDYVWHEETDLSAYDCVVLPGGFSYGDYLRAGSIARFSPVMKAVGKLADGGGLVMGICNGFQILCEAGLLPGALMRNDHLQFRCQWVNLRVETTASLFTNAASAGQVLRVPMAHGDGSYYADDRTLRELEDGGRVLFRYCTPEGEVTSEANPNGSLGNIAGITNESGNVLGMMPHPERCWRAADGRRRRQVHLPLDAGPLRRMLGIALSPAGRRRVRGHRNRSSALSVQHMRPLTVTVVSLVVGAAISVTAAVIVDGGAMVRITAAALPWLIASGLLNFHAGRLLNFTGVSLAGVSRSSPIVGATPLFALVLAVLLGGETVNAAIIAGTLAIIAGLALVLSQQ